MATKKFSAFTAGSTNQDPTDVLVGLDLSLATSAQNTKWTLNNLFAVVTRNITDGALRFGGFAAPAVSGAGEGSIYFDSTSNTFKLSQNAGAYFNVGNVITTGFTSTRIPIANGANTLTDDAGLSYNTTTDFLSIGSATGGGIHFVGTNGNTVALAAQAPAAASYLYYLPNAAPTAGQALYAATVGVQTQLGWTTINGGSGAANQVAVWSATNTLSGSSALTFSSGVLAISGTSSPGATATNTAAGTAGFTADQTVSGAASYSFYFLNTPSTSALVQLTTAAYTPANLVKANQFRLLGAASTVEMLFDLADASTRFVFGVNNVEAASINATSTLGLVLGVASTLTGRVRMYNSAGATYTQLSAGNAAASLNYILPATSPTLNQVLTASAPSGSDVTLSWTTPSSGSSLTATQVGFGSGANALTGSADFTYTDATGVLDLTKTGLNSSVRMTVVNASAGTAAQARFGASADVSGSALIAYSSTFTTSGLRTANSAVLDLDGTTSVFLGQSSGSFKWGLGTVEYARMTTTAFTLYGSNTGSVTGLSVTSAAAGSAITIASVSSGSTEEIFIIPKGNAAVKIGTGGGAGSTDQGLFLSRILNDSNGSGNGHAFVDASIFARTTGGPNGYASFDTPVSVGSASAYDHYVSFQARPTTAASSTWSDIFGTYLTATFGASSTATRNTGVWITPPVMGAGAAITNNVGIWVDGTTAPGTFNYSLISTGVSYFLTHAGAVALGTTTNPSTALHITGNATRESLLRFTPDANASFVGCEWTDNSNTGVIASLKMKASTGEFALNGSTTTFLTFYTNAAEVARLTTGGNLVLGATAAGTSAARVFAVASGTAPSTSPADMAQYYTADAAAGDAQALVRNEAGRIARLTGTVQTLNQTFAKTNTTLANITGSGTDNDLAFNVETGSTYAVRVALQLDAEFAAGGVKVALGGTVTLNTSLSALQVQIWRNDTNVIAASGRITNTASAVSATGAADGSTYFAIIEGTIVVTTGGTLTAQFAQAAASGTSNALAGCYMEIARQS